MLHTRPYKYKCTTAMCAVKAAKIKSSPDGSRNAIVKQIMPSSAFFT